MNLQSVFATPLKFRKGLLTDLSPHLIAHWPCDEGQGGVLNDVSGYNLHLVHGGTPSAGMWAEAGRATFDGVGDCFIAPLNNGSMHSLLRPQLTGEAYTANTIAAATGTPHRYTDGVSGFGALNLTVGEYIEVTGFVSNGCNAVRRLTSVSENTLGFDSFDTQGTYTSAEVAGASVTIKKILPPSIIISMFVKTSAISKNLLWLRDSTAGFPQGVDVSVSATGLFTHRHASYSGVQTEECLTAMNDGAEHHLAVVVDAYSPRRVMFFLDGVNINTGDNWVNAWRYANPSNMTALKAVVGASYLGILGNFFSGTLRNIQVYCQYKKEMWPTSGIVPSTSSTLATSAWLAKLAAGEVLTREDMP